MGWKTDREYFERAVEISKEALKTGNDGFGCLLVDKNGEIIMEQRNAVADEGDPTAHDAMTLIRKAVKTYDSDFLKDCTLYATMEPCVMCMGAAFWADLGAVKFAVTEKELGTILSGGLNMPSTEFAQRSPKEIKVEGPFPQIHDEAFAVMKVWVDKILGK